MPPESRLLLVDHPPKYFPLTVLPANELGLEGKTVQHKLVYPENSALAFASSNLHHLHHPVDVY